MGRRIRLAGTGTGVEGRSWESAALLRVGRLENLEVSINDPSISRRHAEVEFTDQGWVVRDLGSTNGTYLNAIRVGRADQKLKARDVLQFGNVIMVVAALEEEAGTGGETISDGLHVSCSAQHSWDQALEFCASDNMLKPEARERLLALLRVGREFSHIETLDALLRSILHDAAQALRAQGGAILLVEENGEQLALRAINPVSRERDPGVHYSRHLAQRTLTRGESLLCQDTRQDSADGSVTPLANGGIASIISVQVRSPSRTLGVLQLDRGPQDRPFNQDDLRLADAMAASVSTVIESVGGILDRERDLLVRTLTALAQAVDLRDDYTGSHTQRVTDYALMLADEMGLTRLDRYHLSIGTPLHDIGKIGISDYILRKPGPLTAEEAEYMKSHTLKGSAIVEIIPHMSAVVPIVRSHHERWDGLGYPDGLVGTQASLLSRIVGVADAFDAMTTDRPYRRSLSLERAFQQIREKARTQFDPDVAAAFLNLRGRIEEEMLQARQVVDTLSPKEMRSEMSALRPGNSQRCRTVSLPKSAVMAEIQKKLASA